MQEDLPLLQQIHYFVLALWLILARAKLMENATTLFRPKFTENEEDLEFWAYFLTFYKFEG
jgi:hypothetical protein